MGDIHAASEGKPEAKFERLRRQAERLLRDRSDTRVPAATDILDLIHELQVHQVELEIQNDELRRAQQELGDLHRRFEDLYEFAPVGYLSLDAQGLIARINLAGTLLLDSVRQSLIRRGFGQYVAAEFQGAYHRALKNAALTGRKQSLELQLASVPASVPASAPASVKGYIQAYVKKFIEGSNRWVWAEILAGRMPAGEATGYLMTLVDISMQKAVESALTASEQKYRQLFNEMVGGAAVLEIAERNSQGRVADFRILEVNDASEKLSGVPRELAVGRTIRQIWPETETSLFEQADHMLRLGQPIQIEGFHRGIGKHLLLGGFQLDAKRIAITFIDISAHKQIEAELEFARHELEAKVREQTAELLRANRQLCKQVEARERTQQSLIEKSRELEIHALELEETNTALKVLLKERDNERRRLEEKVASNLNELVRPQLAKLRGDNLSPRQQTLIKAIEQHLDDIASPLSRRFIIEAHRLTPAEIQVADQIRQGKSTKEIAELMGVATSTVDYHRLNIRRKLKLTNQRLNLQSYLRSLT